MSVSDRQISAAIVGAMVGPYIWAPLSQYVGRSSLLFWGSLATMCCNIWSACMTHQDQYIAFIWSRCLAGLFGSVSMTLGAGIVIDMFFLHQRGKAFSCYTITTLFGTSMGPTLSGFIVGRSHWPVQFWWCVGALAFQAALVFFFLEDTTYDRENLENNKSREELSYLSNRIATFFPGNKIVRLTKRTSGWAAVMLIFSPPVMLCGFILILTVSWTVGTNVVLAVFLQTPVKKGGYGFSPVRNAEFTFAQWAAFVTAESFGLAFNDRLPLWICKRCGGVWKPEYRLFPLLIPPLVAQPVGLILFGTALQYHLHYMVLATGLFLICFADFTIIPVINNYVAESFIGHSTETYTVLWSYRLILGLMIPFFITEWVALHGSAWAFGTMAILTGIGIGLTCLVFWKGPAIRRFPLVSFSSTEEGVDLVEDEKRRTVE
jgi:MFS family permease